LQVTVQRKELGVSPSDNVTTLLEQERESLTAAKLMEFRGQVDTQIAAFRDTLKKYKESKLRVAGYGAPARVSTICNYGDIGPSLIEFTVDDSPLKQNKFTPGTHIPIVPKAHLDSTDQMFSSFLPTNISTTFGRRRTAPIGICCRFPPKR